MTMGERIRNRREELGLSQDEVAARCGYKSRSSINKIEKTRSLPIDKVEVIAKVLNVPPEYIMGWSEDKYLNKSDTSDLITISDRIKSIRLEKGLTQDELALRMGFSNRSAISKIETAGNDITLKTINKVANALGVTKPYLMGYSDKKTTELDTSIETESSIGITIADRIKDERIKKHMTQLQLAQKMGYKTKSAVSILESSGDNITNKTVKRAAKALDVSEAYLMGWEESILSDVNLTPNEQLMIDRYREIPEEKKSEILGHFLSYTESILKAER